MLFSALTAIIVLFTALRSEAGTMVLYNGAPPSGASVTYDGSGNVTISGFTGTVRVDLYWYMPSDYYPFPVSAPTTFYNYGANEMALQFYGSPDQFARYYFYP